MTFANAKNATLEYLFKSFSHFGWNLEDWVLLDNHYHIMAEAPDQAETLSSAINNFHKFSALWIKKHIQLLDDIPKIWYNYWDTCITNEKAYFARLNYIWHNPVKHGYVENAGQWKFGSYYFRLKNNEPIENIIQNFPCNKLKIRDDY